jgi:hypothetical protein
MLASIRQPAFAVHRVAGVDREVQDHIFQFIRTQASKGDLGMAVR